MSKNNDYYRLAHQDFLYLCAAMKTFPLYNNISVSAQQVSEKLLKSVAELVCPNTEKIMGIHNLRTIYKEIANVEDSINLDAKSLASLKDYYFEARYPGDDFVEVSKEECFENLETMYHVLSEVNGFRKQKGLPTFRYEEKYPMIAQDMDYVDSLYEDNSLEQENEQDQILDCNMQW